MDTEILESIRRRLYDLLNSKDENDINEANTKARVVIPFITHLDFNENWFSYEYPVIKGRQITDIIIKNETSIKMIVEVKSANIKLKPEHLVQLTTYLSIKNVEWGVLTNGKDYILVNKKIDGEYEDMQVIKFNLLDITDEYKLNFLTYNSIFIDKTTEYLKHLTQYKVYKLKENKNNYATWSIYNTTIENYFNYLINFQGYRKPEHLNSDDFRRFIKYEISQSGNNKKKAIKSKETILNKYRHISNFYRLLNKYGKQIANPFENLTEENMLRGINYIEKKNPQPLLVEEIEKVLDGFDRTDNPERNKLIFLLGLYGCLSREDITRIKVEDINQNTNTLKVKDKILKLPPNFVQRILLYIENSKDQNAKVDYLFDSNYGDYSGGPVSISTINETIKKCSGYYKETFKDREPKKITLENIRITILIKRYL